MKCEFNYEKGSRKKWETFTWVMFFVLGAIISLTALIVCVPDYADLASDIAILSFMVFAVLWTLIMTVKLHSLDGIILCGQDSIEVRRKRRKRIISFDNIESVSCMPEVKHTRYAVKHNLIFTVLLKTDEELEFCHQLDVEKSFPVQQPEKFKKYIDEQPLMQVCMYINERLDKNE